MDGSNLVHLNALPGEADAERAVLCAILLDNEAWHSVSSRLNVASFEIPRHRAIYAAMAQLMRSGRAVTLISMKEQLLSMEQLDEIGGIVELSKIADATPTAANVEGHAEIVHASAVRRRLIRICEDIARRAYSRSDPADELVDISCREMLNLATDGAPGSWVELADLMGETVEYIREVYDGEQRAALTGFAGLDRLTGGVGPGQFIVIAGRPSMGKTALSLAIAANHAAVGGRVGLFSLEMTARELALRMLTSEARVDGNRIRSSTLRDEDLVELVRAALAIQQMHVFIDDSMSANASEIISRARKLHQQEKLSLIIVDYIQLISGSKERREESVAEISRSMKMMAKDLDVPVIGVSQLNRVPETRNDKRPMLSDLRESGSIEQDADMVCLLYRDEVYDQASPHFSVAELHLAKQRNGPTGMVPIRFIAEYGRFEDDHGERNNAVQSNGDSGPVPDTEQGDLLPF